MSLTAAIFAVVALGIAALCAVADGALLSVADTPGATPEGPTGGLRDPTHRSLAIARLIAILVAGTAASSALGLHQWSGAGATLAAIAIAIVVVLVGELAPRAAGEAVGAPALDALGGVVRTVELVMRPLVEAGAALDAGLRRLLPPFEPGAAGRAVTAEQLGRIVAPSPAPPRAHRAILHRVFSLSDTEVHEVMVPRADILGIELDTPWSEVLVRVRSSQHARMPVYEDTSDQVTGILFAKDLLPAVIADQEPAAGWQSLIRPATFIPESKTIDAQLRDFKATRNHIAIVVDELGGTAGLVTVENILEEIVGYIRDEPLKAVLIAAAAGAVLMALTHLFRRNGEEPPRSR